MRRSRNSCRKLFVSVMILAGITHGAVTFPGSPTKHALLIGIDEYKAEHVSDLRGCVNDVELMRSVLIGKFDVSPENVRVLKNEEATHDGIIEAIRTHLIAKANPGDVVILHYSGHGSKMIDDSDDEIDGYDETLVPHDSRTEGVFDISDDQINGLLKQLTAKTRNVTFIFDSCHSGAAARAGNTVRMILPDERPPPQPPNSAISSRGVGEGGVDFRINGSDYVLISGCLATELSNEALFDQRRHGAMTWFLAQVLQAASDTSTYRSVVDEVSAEVNARYPSQHPQVEGPGIDLRVFGIDHIHSLPYVLVEPTGSKTVRLDGGKIYGLCPQSVLDVYSPDTVDFSAAQPMAKIRITQAEDFTAHAEIVGGGPIKPHSKAVLEAVAFGETAIPVHVQTGDDQSLGRIKKALKPFEAIDLTETESDARLIVATDDGNIIIQSGDLELLTPPVSIAEPGHVDHVANQVKDIVHWITVMDLKSPTQAIKMGFDLRRGGDPPGAPAPPEVPPGARLTYRVHNRDKVPLYVYVLDVSSDGSITLLYPSVVGTQEELPWGQTLEKTIEMFLPSDRHGVIDVLKVIATTRPINPSVFPQGPIRGAPPPSEARAVEDPLARFLERSIREGTRGGRPVEVKSWVTAQRSVTIRRPGVRFWGFSLHYGDIRESGGVPTSFAASRSVCGGQDDTGDCFEPIQFSKDGTVWELIQRKAVRGAADTVLSVGEVFNESYKIQDQTPGALRVEPLLEVQVPGVIDQQGIDKRGIPSDLHHDEAARNDDQWHLKQIRVTEAWQKIREAQGVGEGSEAAGILIAHTDTGYREHPETWNEGGGKRPIDPTKGYDYYENEADPRDPLLDNLPLDNPGHGTASGSVIVSPAGCQLRGADGCVNGVARGAQLLPLRVHRTVSQYNTSNLARAIQDVGEGNVSGKPRLVSVAMGGPPTFTMWKAVKTAEKNGVLVVAAAGNYVRTVVWPARFSSTIAVAANNVRCRPWKHSSHGNKVDITAPGESVWRATLNEQHEYINAMGKGTTFATGNTSGAAALWLAHYRDNPQMEQIRKEGLVTKVFRRALEASAWRIGADPTWNPPGTKCDTVAWDRSDFGPGILDVKGLLDLPLEIGETREIVSEELPELPLFSSLYPHGTDPGRIRDDYLSLFGSRRDATMEMLTIFETELLYHYTMDDDVQRTFDALVEGQRGAEPSTRVRRALLRQDLSDRLRSVLGD